jgi:hypothetical protein
LGLAGVPGREKLTWVCKYARLPRPIALPSTSDLARVPLGTLTA